MITVRLDIDVVQKAEYTMGDIHFNDNNCVFDVEEEGFYVKRINPFSSCGTSYVVRIYPYQTFNNLASKQI